jgi:hypothetical protein
MEDSARTDDELAIISSKLGKHLAEYEQKVEQGKPPEKGRRT